MKEKRYIFKFYYIGSKKLHGSQRQPSYQTTENILLDALQIKNYIFDPKSSGFEVASRTDKLVSARAAVFTCLMEKAPILMEINTALPRNMGIWAYSEVPNDFLSRFNAKVRHYKYIYPLDISSLQENYTIDFNLITKACEALKGRHDFKNFHKKGKEEVKTIRDMNLVKMTTINDYIIFDFQSLAFLRQQIRRMVKQIMDLGLGKITYDEFMALLITSKYISYQPADPTGLILWDIQYDSSISFIVDNKSKARMEKYFLRKKFEYNHKYQLFSILEQSDFS